MHAIKLALSIDFLQGFSRLGKEAQKKTRAFIDKFRADPRNKSLNYKSLEGMRDPKVRSARVSQKYRAIIIHPPKGDVYLLAWVDNHDEAMDWARNKVFGVNRYTGTFQVYEESPDVVADVETVETGGATVGDDFLLAGKSDEDLLFLGVPQPLLPAVRSLRTERDLDSLIEYLPSEAADALAMLVAGYSVEETFDELVRTDTNTTPDALQKAITEAREREPADPNDFAAALNREQSKREFKLLEDDAELAAILAEPTALWRVFLHPSQARLVAMNSKDAARVLGGAGTGKTVVAMHRARYLAKNVFTQDHQRVLVTTFTKNLAADIRTNLDQMCGEEGKRIEVKHIHKVARDILRREGHKVPRIAGSSEQRRAWNGALNTVEPNYSRVFYREEWDKVIQAQDVTSLAAYFKARRAGRGQRLTRRQRGAVWEVMAAYREQLDLAGLWEHADVIREARLLLASKEPKEHVYASVVADEIQDFRTADLKLLRALATGENSLFVVGDPHQRIYGHKASLSRCGINIRGRRSRKLRLNYRTTHKIRNWAVARLQGLTIDDLDGGEDNLKGERSLRDGTPPRVHMFESLEAEAEAIAAQIREWQASVKGDQRGRKNLICLVARVHSEVKAYAAALARHNIETQEILTDADDAAVDTVRVATMHRVKGLEFPYVIIAGVGEGTYPYRDSDYDNRDSVTGENYDESERKLMYVSATRARDELMVTGNGVASRWLV